MPAGGRRYDKGERRFKHVGKGSKPSIQFDEREPRRWVGKCPENIPDAQKQALLDRAVAAPNGDREAAYPKLLYVVHDGAIYQAQTSDGGRSYHGYPYKGRLSRPLLRTLEAMSVSEGTAAAFRRWVEDYIEVSGGT
jgi:hypothetical protein